MTERWDGAPGQPGPKVPLYVISVAAQLTGLHPQTLRSYDRLGIVSPGRTGGGGRRYSWRDIETLREVADLTAAGIGLEGVRRILRLELEVDALRGRVAELEADLAAADLLLRITAPHTTHRHTVSHPSTMETATLRETTSRNLPAVRAPSSGHAVTVWRRGRF